MDTEKVYTTSLRLYKSRPVHHQAYRYAGKEEKERILSHYLEPFFQVPENILQIENYIFQLQYMTYEKEKANHMLEALLKQENIQYDLEAMLTEGKIKAAVPVKKDRAMG